MKKLKIAVLIDQLIPGGVQKIAAAEVKYLNGLGHDATLLILTRLGYQKKFRRLVKNIPHRFLQDQYPFYARKNFKLPFFASLSAHHLISPIAAAGIIKKQKPDIIISHGTTTSLTALASKLFFKIPYILMIHDPMVYILAKIYKLPWPERPRYYPASLHERASASEYKKSPIYLLSPLIKTIATFLEKNLVQNASACVIDSRFHQKFIRDNYKVEPRIIYLGTEISQKPTFELGDRILTTGRWGKGKNLQLLLQILQNLPKTKLTVAGIWPDQKDLLWFKELLRQKNLQDRVRLIPYYNDRDLPKIASHARVWVLPHEEAFSIAALEAASLGLPIIIPKNSGVTDLLKDGRDGTFPSKINVQTLKNALKVYLNDKNLAKSQGKNAAQNSRDFYSLKKHAFELAKLAGIQKIKPNREIIALEAGHVGKIGNSGGDLLLSKMLTFYKNHPRLSLIIPQDNTFHWQRLKKNVKIIPLKHTFLDDYTSPWLVLANYLMRTIKITPKLIRTPSGTIIYSSTDTLPDVLPALVAKVLRPRHYWIARIHHLPTPPSTRPGNFFINMGSLLIGKISTYAIRKYADIVLVLNDSVKATLLDCGFKKEKLEILGGGVDFRRISRFKPQTNEGYDAVYLGRIHGSKGIFDLPSIWEEVVAKNKTAILAIIGTGSQDNIENLKKMIAISKLSKNISILGFIPEKRLWGVLKNSKVFLFTDYEAGFGLAAAEAMASGLPVVGYDIGILSNVYKKGFIKVAPAKTQDFASSITEVLGNSNLRKKLSQEAMVEASRHDWQNISLKFKKILSTIN